MQSPDASGPGDLTADGRPTAPLPIGQLIQISLYWLGLTAIFTGLNVIMTGRLVFTGLVPEDEVGRTLFRLTVFGALIADHRPADRRVDLATTRSRRWGRRKPYIFIGSILDVVFLVGIATEHDLVADRGVHRAAPVQLELRPGPVPGLHPGPRPGRPGRRGERARRDDDGPRQRGGLSSIGGHRDRRRTTIALGLIALGVLELVTMLSVVVRVREGSVAEGPEAAGRGGRSPARRGARTSCASTASSGWSGRGWPS